MAFSVNTNEAALNALQNLNITTEKLNKVQNRINTGLRIASSKDDASIYSIAQKLRADLRGHNAVKQSLDRSISTVDIALAATESISDLLIEMKEKAVAAADAGLDTVSRTALSQDFDSLRSQILIITQNASFNGTNLINSSTDELVAITSPDALNKITISHETLTLGGAVIVISATQSVATLTAASAAATDVSTSLANVNAVLTRFGAGVKSLEAQKVFASKISDTIKVGIGNLVDADMARESARLQSLQVTQQLGVRLYLLPTPPQEPF